MIALSVKVKADRSLRCRCGGYTAEGASHVSAQLPRADRHGKNGLIHAVVCGYPFDTRALFFAFLREKTRLQRKCRAQKHFFCKFSHFLLAFFPESCYIKPIHPGVPLPCERAPIAQLDRAADYGSAGWEFKSLWVHHLSLPRGRSKMVMLQLPKLATTVRFRSPAPSVSCLKFMIRRFRTVVFGNSQKTSGEVIFLIKNDNSQTLLKKHHILSFFRLDLCLTRGILGKDLES